MITHPSPTLQPGGKMVQKESHNPSPVVAGQYSRAWASRVINALLTDFEAGESTLPDGFVMKGVNMVKRENGTVIVGFVFAKEG